MSNKVVDFLSAKEEKANEKVNLSQEVEQLKQKARDMGVPEAVINKMVEEAKEESAEMQKEVEKARQGAIRAVLKEIGVPEELIDELDAGSAEGITKFFNEKDWDYGIGELEPLPIPLPMGLGVSAVGAIAIRDSKTEKVIADCVWHVIPMDAKEAGLENVIKKTNTTILFANAESEGMNKEE